MLVEGFVYTAKGSLAYKGEVGEFIAEVGQRRHSKKWNIMDYEWFYFRKGTRVKMD